MPVITAITAHAKKPGRFEVFVDGQPEGAVSVEAIERLRLGVGVSFDPVRPAFAAELALVATWDRATRLLAARARSRAELRRQLLLKGEAAGAVDAALDRLERAGYLDDADYARQFARSKALGRGMSRRRVQQELAKRGISRELAEAALADVFADEGVGEGEAVARLARKKLRSLIRLDAPTRRRRLYAFLARRGFEHDDISRVLRDLGEDGVEPTD